MPAIRELDPTAGPLDFFGAEVRRWRTSAGLSQEQLGQRIGYSAALVGKVETGDRTPSLDFAEGCDRALPTADGLFGRLYELARHWDGGYPSWFAEWVEAERRAITLRTWQPLLVPGLLQTPDYARALFLAWHVADSDDQVDQLVDARIERQAIFRRPTRRRCGPCSTKCAAPPHRQRADEERTVCTCVACRRAPFPEKSRAAAPTVLRRRMAAPTCAASCCTCWTCPGGPPLPCRWCRAKPVRTSACWALFPLPRLPMPRVSSTSIHPIRVR